MNQKEYARANGIKMNPGGTVNSYQLAKFRGRLGSRKDHTWVRNENNPSKGHHSCCGSKRDYYHKIGCKAAGGGPDDLSDLKDL